MRLSMPQMPRRAAAGLTAPSIGPPGLSLWPNAEKYRGRPPEEARLLGVYRLPAPACHPHGWPDLAGVGPPGSSKFGRTAIARASASPARRDFAISHFRPSRQASTGFRAKRPPATTVGSHLAEKQLPGLVIFVERRLQYARL